MFCAPGSERGPLVMEGGPLQGGTLAVRLPDRWLGWRHLAHSQVGFQRPRKQPSQAASNRLRSLLTRLVRGRYLLAYDLVGIAFAAYLALELRADPITGPSYVPAAPFAIALMVAVRTVANIRLGLYSRRWRFASVPDLERIAIAVLLGSVGWWFLFYGALTISGNRIGDGFPQSFWVLEALLSVAILGGGRFAIRA